MNAGLVRRGGVTALVPSLMLSYLGTSGGMIEREGIELPAAMWTALEPATGNAVPVERRIGVPLECADELDSLAPAAAADRRFELDGPTVIDVLCASHLEEEVV